MPITFTKRDREASAYIHKLFHEAWFQDKPDLIVWALTRPAALFVYNVLIPFQVAYCLQAIITKHFDRVLHYAILVLVMGLIYCVLWAIGGLTIIRNARAGLKYVQHKVFANYLEKDYEFLNNTYLGSLGAQANRLRETLDEYDQVIFNGFIKDIILVVASVTIIAMHSVVLAVVTLVSMALVLGFTIAITKWRIKYRRLLSEASSDTAGVISDALGHGATVKSFAAEDYEKQRLEKSLEVLAQTQYESWWSSIPADLGRQFLAAAATFVILILTARLYQNRNISIAIVILVQLYVIKLVMATQDIADRIKAYESTMSAAHQAVKTMLIEPTVKDPERPAKLPKNMEFDVDLQQVSFRYPDAPPKVLAVRDFSLHIRQVRRSDWSAIAAAAKRPSLNYCCALWT